MLDPPVWTIELVVSLGFALLAVRWVTKTVQTWRDGPPEIGGHESSPASRIGRGREQILAHLERQASRSCCASPGTEDHRAAHPAARARSRRPVYLRELPAHARR